MAGAGAKKRLDENARRVFLLRTALLVAVACFVLVRKFLLSPASTSSWHWTGLGISSVVAWISYAAVASFAKATYDSSGELLDGGGDLNKPGSTVSYAHDIIYLTVTVQVLASFFNWAWFILLCIPGYGTYKLCEKVIVPYLRSIGAFGPDKSQKRDPAVDEELRKRMERTEKRAQRRANKWH